MMLVALWMNLSSCESYSLEPYGKIDRCTCTYVGEEIICNLHDYDFNIPNRVSDSVPVEITECLEQFGTFHIFDSRQWSTEIVPAREQRKYLEDSTSRKDFVKRVKSL